MLTNKKNFCLKNDTDINRPVDQVPTGLYQLKTEAEATLCHATAKIQELCQPTPWHPNAKFGMDVSGGEKKKSFS